MDASAIGKALHPHVNFKLHTFLGAWVFQANQVGMKQDLWRSKPARSAGPPCSAGPQHERERESGRLKLKYLSAPRLITEPSGLRSERKVQSIPLSPSLPLPAVLLRGSGSLYWCCIEALSCSPSADSCWNTVQPNSVKGAEACSSFCGFSAT